MNTQDLKILLLSHRLPSSQVAKIVGLKAVEVNRFLSNYREDNHLTFKR